MVNFTLTKVTDDRFPMTVLGTDEAYSELLNKILASTSQPSQRKGQATKKGRCQTQNCTAMATKDENNMKSMTQNSYLFKCCYYIEHDI